MDVCIYMALSRLLRCPSTTWDNKMASAELGQIPFYTVFHGETDFGHENAVDPVFHIVLKQQMKLGFQKKRISKNVSCLRLPQVVPYILYYNETNEKSPYG